VVAFLAVTGMPEEMVAVVRRGPAWGYLLGLAHTLPHDAWIVGDGAVPDLSGVAVPVLVGHGGATRGNLVDGAEAVVAALPDATLAVLPEQTHQVQETVLGPVLLDFFRAG
jgi:hypothetical protein